MTGRSMRVEIGGRELVLDADPEKPLRDIIEATSASGAYPPVMGSVEIGGCVVTFDDVWERLRQAHNGPPSARPPKRRDTKPAAKPRKRERRSARHTQRRR